MPKVTAACWKEYGEQIKSGAMSPEEAMRKFYQPAAELDKPKPKKKGRYKVAPKEQRIYEGWTFDSRGEMDYYIGTLKPLVRVGIALHVLRQVPFHFPGGVKYICDFVVFYADGRVRYLDFKGHRTQQFKTKMKLLQEHYPHVKLEEVK